MTRMESFADADEAIDHQLAAIDARLSRIDARIDALTWRFAVALAAQTLAIIGAVAALLRLFPAN